MRSVGEHLCGVEVEGLRFPGMGPYLESFFYPESPASPIRALWAEPYRLKVDEGCEAEMLVCCGLRSLELEGSELRTSG